MNGFPSLLHNGKEDFDSDYEEKNDYDMDEDDGNVFDESRDKECKDLLYICYWNHSLSTLDCLITKKN